MGRSGFRGGGRKGGGKSGVDRRADRRTGRDKNRRRSVLDPAKDQAVRRGEEDLASGVKKSLNSSLPKPPDILPSVDEKATEKRAGSLARKILTKKAIGFALVACGLAVPSEAISIGLICGLPLAIAIGAFISSRCFGNVGARLFMASGYAMFAAAILVFIRGLFAQANISAKAGAILTYVFTGLPTGFVAPLIDQGALRIPIVHAFAALVMIVFGVLSLWLHYSLHDRCRPRKPADYHLAKRKRLIRACAAPGARTV